jgi:Ca2+-binding RTX toxin-like protein
MSIKRLTLLLTLGFLVTVSFSILAAFSAANLVPPSRAFGSGPTPITANSLKPPECTMSLAAIRYVTPGVAFVSDGNSNDLIIGTAGADTISAGKGHDCILGGGGNDTINGDQGNDVIFGGPGDDDLDGFNGTDTCYGGGQAGDTFNRCETIYP